VRIIDISRVCTGKELKQSRTNGVQLGVVVLLRLAELCSTAFSCLGAYVVVRGLSEAWCRTSAKLDWLVPIQRESMDG